jgi:hypothetical protein
MAVLCTVQQCHMLTCSIAMAYCFAPQGVHLWWVGLVAGGACHPCSASSPHGAFAPWCSAPCLFVCKPSVILPHHQHTCSHRLGVVFGQVWVQIRFK